MRVSNIILHVGAGKTGSSALQSFFTENRDALNAAGADYPVQAIAPGRQLSGNVRPILDYASDRRAPASSLSPRTLAAEIRPILRTARTRRVVLSNEQIYKAGEGKLAVIRDALATVDPAPTAVCVFRDDLLARTSYAVRSSMGRTDAKAVFGAENVRFVVYSPDPAENLRRFLEAAGVEARDWAPPPPTNRSLTAFEIGVMRRLNAISLDGGLDPSALHRIANTLTSRPAPDAGVDDERMELDEAVWTRFAELTRAINAECFPHGGGLPEPQRAISDRSRRYATLDPEVARLADLLAQISNQFASQARPAGPLAARALARVRRAFGRA